MVYRKPTDTDQYLHYSSHHQTSCKESVVSSLFNRALFQKLSQILYSSMLEKVIYPDYLSFLANSYGLRSNIYSISIQRANRLRKNNIVITIHNLVSRRINTKHFKPLGIIYRACIGSIKDLPNHR